MKKIKLLIIVLVCLFVVNVKADMGGPSIVVHKATVTNKNGAQCYDSSDSGYRKTDQIIPYGTVLEISSESDGSYIWAREDRDEDDIYSCYVKYADISAKNQSFSVKDNESEKITPAKVVILAKGGINLRKGPSVTYSKIITIPEKAVVTVTYRAGSYWYYTTYNGKSGWFTTMNGYAGFEANKVLINKDASKIYDKASGGKVIGTIPANTEISNYLECIADSWNDPHYYVNYKGIKGYIYEGEFHVKIDSPGKIQLIKDDILDVDDNGNPTNVIKAGKQFEYTRVGKGENDFYIPERKEMMYFSNDMFKYITKAKISVKTTGYIGEGLYGEKKTVAEEKKEETPIEPKEEVVIEPVIEEEEDIKKSNGISPRDMIIIGLLAGIFLALTALVIIKLMAVKKAPVAIHEEKKPVKKSEIDEARETIEKRITKETKKNIKLEDEINNIKSHEEK